MAEMGTNLKAEFERNYKDAFLKTVDLVSLYTGIYMECEFKNFVYDFNNSYMETCATARAKRGKRKFKIYTTITIPPKHATTALYKYPFSLLAAHEAGEISYYAARHYAGRKQYTLAGEIAGEFFLRLFCKKYNIDRSLIVPDNFSLDGHKFDTYGRYKVASKIVDDWEELPFKEQIKYIRTLFFMRDNIILDIGEMLSNLLDRLEEVK